MSDYKITVQLKQYTPMLHFQAEESGACLRASEVKPRLDRFVLTWLSQNGVDGIRLPYGWSDQTYKDKKCEKPEKPLERISLRYRMHFEAPKAPNGKETSSELHKLYFGNMGKKNDHEKMKSLFYAAPQTMTILCLASGVIDVKGQRMTLSAILRKLIPAFFALHNFGTRSNKGFGSFGVIAMDGEEIDSFTPEELAQFLPKEIPALYYLSNENSDTYLNDIQALSVLMKGGVNLTHGNPKDLQFQRDAIRLYFGKNGGFRSEKAMIKKFILPEKDEDDAVEKLFSVQPVQKIDECRYVRGLLGITEGVEYRVDERKDKKTGVKVKNNPHSYRFGKVKIQGKDKDKTEKKPLIARFANPVLFKPYEGYLLMIPHPVPEKMLGAPFVFESGGNRRTLRTPDAFDIDDFMQFFAEVFESIPQEKADAFSHSRIEIGKYVGDMLQYNSCISRAPRKGGDKQ